jgi:hypothetical protein
LDVVRWVGGAFEFSVAGQADGEVSNTKVAVKFKVRLTVCSPALGSMRVWDAAKGCERAVEVVSRYQ